MKLRDASNENSRRRRSSNFNFVVSRSAVPALFSLPSLHRENRTSFNEPERNEFHRTLQNRVE